MSLTGVDKFNVDVTRSPPVFASGLFVVALTWSEVITAVTLFALLFTWVLRRGRQHSRGVPADRSESGVG